ncbi:MAG: orotidine-5'-phosphate decarboxylase, partial [Anaerolineae bacterium]|nr:orotidine-5'-phosphate decarboxylase [Anaerolineae bacterium]
MQPKDRLIFALDVPTLADAVRYAQWLDGHVGCFKVGLQLFISEGPEVIRAIREHSSVDIFLDLKLHDIPATVRSAVKSAVNHNVQYLTVHCSGGMEMLRAAKEGAQGSALKLLGVTVLTSTGASEMAGAGSSSEAVPFAGLVLERTRMA